MSFISTFGFRSFLPTVETQIDARVILASLKEFSNEQTRFETLLELTSEQMYRAQISVSHHHHQFIVSASGASAIMALKSAAAKVRQYLLYCKAAA